MENILCLKNNFFWFNFFFFFWFSQKNICWSNFFWSNFFWSNSFNQKKIRSKKKIFLRTPTKGCFWIYCCCKSYDMLPAKQLKQEMHWNLTIAIQIVIKNKNTKNSQKECLCLAECSWIVTHIIVSIKQKFLGGVPKNNSTEKSISENSRKSLRWNSAQAKNHMQAAISRRFHSL